MLTQPVAIKGLPAPDSPPAQTSDDHLASARDALQSLLYDNKIPPEARASLATDYHQIELMLDKLEHGHIHIAVFGRVSVGKSALLNALLGEARFRTSPLHGETKEATAAAWQEAHSGGVFLIDTPGINEISGEAREKLAHEVAGRSDLVLFVVDGDITETELGALRVLRQENRPLLLVLNKIDRYSPRERELILQNLALRSQGLIPVEHIVTAAAQPAEKVYISIDEQGQETEITRSPPNNVGDLRELLWTILEAEGKTLAALNAGLFAGKLSEQIATRIIAVRRGLAESVVRTYCIGKGIAIAANPIPIADVLAASAIDAAMVMHLGKIYGMDLNREEAGELLTVVGKQMAVIGVISWLSSALKGASFGLSTLITAGVQGVAGYYGSYIVGQAAERYFIQGKSWGEHGAKQVIQDILAHTDRDSILQQARADILQRLRVQTS